MDIGIDLGTTFSVLAVSGRVELAPDYPPPRYLEECDVTIIPTPDGEMTFASVAVEDPDRPGQLLFAAEALERAAEGHALVMFSKRKMGTKETIALTARSVTAKDIAREFLRHLKRIAERALGQTVRRAVVTHPAHFDRAAVEETRQAAAEAGFDMALPEQLLMEPVAAALTYTRTDDRDPLRILAYDLGGGTFDVTYMERRAGVIEMRAFDGDHLLGGYNFDRELAHWVRSRLAAQGRETVLEENDPEDRARLARMLQLAEKSKIALAELRSDTEKVELRWRDLLVDTAGKPIQINERITRSEFIRLIAPHLNRTIECCRRALERAAVAPHELNEVLLVGGSTKAPWVQARLSEEFPHLQPKLFEPDLCVGAGAAIHARQALPALVIDRRYKLLLGTPPTSVFETFSVFGSVVSTDGRALGAPLTIDLRLDDGRVMQGGALRADGQFLIADVPLTGEQPNDFLLSFRDGAGAAVLEHAFQVQCAPHTHETTGISTVLPKPLFLETLDGLIPLAAEGAPLPARCEVHLRKNNDRPEIDLKLFQEGRPVGRILLADRRLQGHVGANIDITVEVTDKNEIRGSAQVYSPPRKLILSHDVAVVFQPPPIPEVAELERRWEWVQRQAAILTDQPGLELHVLGPARPLLDRLEILFAQQPIERQEIEVILRELEYYLGPPDDPLSPSRIEFCLEAAELRANLEQLSKGKPLDDGDEAPSSAQQKLAEKFLVELDEVEEKALVAHAVRRRTAWEEAKHELDWMHGQIAGWTELLQSQPTPLLKALAVRDLAIVRRKLQQREEKLASSGVRANWQSQIDQIEESLGEIIGQVFEVDDALPNTQALARIRAVMSQVSRIESRINSLGVDV